MKSKICGLPSLEVAMRVMALGPNAIGIYCWTEPEKGRNFITRETARRIAQMASGASIQTFYLTYDALTAEEVYEDCSFIGNTHVQLIGDIAPQEIVRVKQLLPALQTVKVIGVTGPESIEEAHAYNSCEAVDQLLLDSRSGSVARGGTGKTHDWDISRQIIENCQKPVWLAGGIRLHNVVEAMSIVRPYGIDVETGVQHPDGSKDYAAIEEFIHAVRSYSRN